MKYLLSVVLSLLLLSSPALAARQSVLTLPAKVDIATPDSTPPQAIRASIIQAATHNGWFIHSNTPGQLELRFNKGSKHELIVAVRYDAHSYQLLYVSSVNLNYDNTTGVERIHPNANRWIARLNLAINRATGQNAAASEAAGRQDGNAADE